MFLQKYFSKTRTPQNMPIPGSTQVANSAGGFAWAVDDWVRLDRFLVLGSEGGTYYINERKLTLENAEAVARCIQLDGLRTVARIVEISETGRAPKNDAALFALALAAGTGDLATRRDGDGSPAQGCTHGHTPIPLHGLRRQFPWLGARHAPFDCRLVQQHASREVGLSGDQVPAA